MKIDSICLFGYVFNEITNKWSGSAFSRIEILYGYKNFVSLLLCVLFTFSL